MYLGVFYHHINNINSLAGEDTMLIFDRKNVILRGLSIILCLVALLSFCVALNIQAVDINGVEEKKEDFLWQLDFNQMSSLTDNKGSEDYSLEAKNAKKVTLEGQSVLSISKTSGYYYIRDTKNQLNTYDTFCIEADMYYESYPVSASATAEQTPSNYPMSFVTWMTKSSSASSFSYRSIRINDEGYLCTGNTPEENPEQVTNVKLPLGEWFNIRFLVSPSNGSCEIFLRGESVLVYSLNGAVKNLSESVIRFFDNRYKYSVNLRNVSVYSDNNYRIGFVEEDAADYIAYQTTGIEKKKIDGVEKNCFNLRIVSGVNTLEYSKVGYHVSAIYTKGGEEYQKQFEVSTRTVFDAIRSGGIFVPAQELDAKYLMAVSIGDVEADCERIEFVIRPYVMADGIKKYGESAILVWSGEKDSSGYPALNYADSYLEYTFEASEDTYTKQSNADNFGSSSLVELKNNGKSSTYTRNAFFKFDFNELNDLGRLRLSSGNRIYFEFYVETMRTLTDEEKLAGGLLCDVYCVSSEWSESTLSGKNVKTEITSGTKIGQMRYMGKRYNQIDVTEYVLEHLNTDKKISFKLVNVVEDGDGSQTKISSTESGKNAPRLCIKPMGYAHSVNLGKLNNNGYEPWGYAEKLVDEWFATERDELYSHEPYETRELEKIDMSKPNGAYTVEFTQYGNNPTSAKLSTLYARRLSTLEGFNASDVTAYDIYGGVTNAGISGTATGLFHTETIGGRTYIIDPLGNPFFSVGINTAQLGANDNQKNAALAKYNQDADAFFESVSAEMRSLGINTYWGGDDGFLENGICKVLGLSCMSGYMGNGTGGLGLSVSTGGSAEYRYNNTMNVFDPDFAAYCDRSAKKSMDKYINGSMAEYKSHVIGFYSDNEIPSQADMLSCYLTVDHTEPVNAFSYATAWTYLMRATGKPNPTIYDVTPKFSEEFKAFVYSTYFKCVTEALDKAGAEDYMYLGNRIHSENKNSEGYLRAASKYVDIISVNLYGGVQPPVDIVETIYRYSGKPMLVSEFFAKANDALDMNGYQLGNQQNAGLMVKTQEDRATFYENYTLLLLESQNCVGWTWYRFRDNDQTVYKDSDGNLYRAFDQANGSVTGYVNLSTGEKVMAANAPQMTIQYKGETDTSNLGSNKGIYDNNMNLYQTLANSIKTISDNLFGIVNYFDAIYE